jgi:hypothetical protein
MEWEGSIGSIGNNAIGRPNTPYTKIQPTRRLIHFLTLGNLGTTKPGIPPNASAISGRKPGTNCNVAQLGGERYHYVELPICRTAAISTHHTELDSLEGIEERS